MKITVIYGNHSQAAQKRFYYIIDTVKKRGWEISYLQKDNRSLAEKLSSTSFFEEQKLYVLDDISILSSKDQKWLTENHERFDTNLLIYHEGELSKKLTDIVGSKAKLEKFLLPKTIFAFLESVKPNNESQVIKLLHEVTTTEAVELVFAMLSTQLRDLYWVKTEPKSYKAPPWKSSKLERQARLFTEKKLAEMIAQLAELDIKVKTSDTNLASQLDLFLISSLK